MAHPSRNIAFVIIGASDRITFMRRILAAFLLIATAGGLVLGAATASGTQRVAADDLDQRLFASPRAVVIGASSCPLAPTRVMPAALTIRRAGMVRLLPV